MLMWLAFIKGKKSLHVFTLQHQMMVTDGYGWLPASNIAISGLGDGKREHRLKIFGIIFATKFQAEIGKQRKQIPQITETYKSLYALSKRQLVNHTKCVTYL